MTIVEDYPLNTIHFLPNHLGHAFADLALGGAERDGVTVVLVSHSADIVREACTRALWLDAGRLVLDGPAGAVLDAFQGKISGPSGPHDRA